MLEYSEKHLCEESVGGRKRLRVYVNDYDFELEGLVKSRYYEIDERYARPVSQLALPRSLPERDLPEGFRIKSLADDNNLRKIHRVL